MEGRGLDNRPIETGRANVVGEVIVCFETGVGLTEGVVGWRFLDR